MIPLMSPSEIEADALVRAYLDGRTLPKILHGAVVWVAETRLTKGRAPVLDANLRANIDHQASGPLPPGTPAFAAAIAKPRVCALLRRDPNRARGS